MSSQKQEVKEAVISALAEHADSAFGHHGFKRAANSLRYTRKLLECTQAVEVFIEHTPSDNQNAAAAVYPWISVAIPAIDAIAVNMAGGDPALLSADAATLHQPIELTSPAGVGARWFLYQPDSVIGAIREFGLYATQWVFPFLDEYSGPKGVVSLNGDERVLHDQDQFLRVIAAMIYCGELDAANKMLLERFGRPAMRRRFARVFDFVKDLSSEAK